MIKENLFLKTFNLQLFAEGGDGGTGSEGATGENGTAAVSQTSITDADGTTATTIDREAEFEKLIKGEYKDLYDARMQDTIKNRLKGQKETVEKYEALAPTLETLAKKYGVDASDISALNKAIEEDDAYYEEEALEKGVTVEQLKEFKKMERENAELKKLRDENDAKKAAEQKVAGWMKESEQVKAIYPQFDLRSEMQNSKFIDLLQVPGVDVRTAYELTHKDEIIAGAMQFTAKTVEKKIADKIAANGARPTENGLNSQSASITKSDVSQLSKADILDIQRRVARGEKISFG
jgi:bisphosphoglycerate-dependent phosphoglycerate mutase